jgi:hypothetical protein
MRANKFAFFSILLFGARIVPAQVVASVEISDPGLRTLQEQSFNNLKTVGQNITGYPFNFPFYLSRTLDIDEKVQKRTDQHSIRFEHYNGATVIAISGNYYGAYTSDKFSPEQRARQTFQDVVVPILKAAVPTFQGNTAVQGFAVEVSHHVISKTMGMPIERPENLMIYLPQSAARKLVEAQNTLTVQAALLDADVLLNAKQLSIWLADEEEAPLKQSPPLPPDMARTATQAMKAPVPETNAAENVAPQHVAVEAANRPVSRPGSDPRPPIPANPPPPVARDSSPQALADLQSSIQDVSNHILKDLEPNAHFVAYAPPAVIPFHQHVYLELSLTTILAEPPETSRYKLAALAFDEHISPLIRGVLAYFPGDQKFDGISFSTTIRPRTKPGMPPAKAMSVEFFFSLETLRRYQSYDCTGQQLLNDGIVLINGERAGLDLELAQGIGRP